jgi:hypothetical protein
MTSLSTYIFLIHLEDAQEGVVLKKVTLNSSFSSIFSKEQGSFREGRRQRRRTLHLHRWQVAGDRDST